MAIITKYDISGIQDFIFNSNILKENIGASIIVNDIMTEYLPEAIKDILKDNEYVLDWEKNNEFKLINSANIKAEIIYIGGGNAVVAYKDEDIEYKVSSRFSKIVFEKTYVLNVIKGYINTDFTNFNEDIRKLNEKIIHEKYRYLRTHPLYGVSITKQDSETGLPVSMYDGKSKEYISKDRFLKRRKANDVIYEDMLQNKNKYAFSMDLDYLGRSKTDLSYIGVIHIDGNSIGKKIDNIISKENNYLQAVATMRLLSKSINEIFNNAFKKLIRTVENNMKQFEDKLSITTSESNKKYLPIRPILLGGDDLTFICDGRIALSCTEYILKKIDYQKLPKFNERISACGGIAIVKSHFPFFRAYEIAEQCCQSAKKKAKFLYKKKKDKRVKSWMDFHLNHSGITNDLDEVRKRQYNVSDLGNPNYKLGQGKNSQLTKYHLLWRPWLISKQKEDKENIFNWNYFINIHKEFEKWPRSRAKKLRNALMKGKIETDFLINSYKSRKINLPEDIDIKGGFYEDEFICTPYFDELEFLEMYLPLEVEDKWK